MRSRTALWHLTVHLTVAGAQISLERRRRQDSFGDLDMTRTDSGGTPRTAWNASHDDVREPFDFTQAPKIFSSELNPGKGAQMLARACANPAGTPYWHPSDGDVAEEPKPPPFMPQKAPHQIEVIPLHDEWDPAEGLRVVADPKVSQAAYGVCLFAEVPGAGKTTAVKLAFPKALFVVPNHALEKDLHGQSLAAMTADQFFALEPGFTELPARILARPDLQYYDAICFEEIGMQSKVMLTAIKRWMREENPNISIVGTGDLYQLPPDGEAHLMHERKRIVDDIFPKRIILTENKRCLDAADRIHIKAVCDEIRTSRDPLSVVQSNFTIVEDLLCLNQDGLVAIASKSTTCELVNMMAQGEYCRSCESLQGMSVQGVLLVLDSPTISREWLFTAVTRSRNLDLVFILREDKIPGKAFAKAQKLKKPKGNDMVKRSPFFEQWHGVIPPQPAPSGGKGMLRRQEYNYVMNPDLIHMTMRNVDPNDGYVQLKGV